MSAERALMSRAQQIFSIRRRLAFLRELERRLKEKAAVLDAYKPARRSPSLAVCSSYHASSASQRLAATGPLTGGGMPGSSLSGPLPSHLPLGAKADRQHPGRYPQSGSGARPGNSASSQGQRSGAPVSGKAAK